MARLIGWKGIVLVGGVVAVVFFVSRTNTVIGEIASSFGTELAGGGLAVIAGAWIAASALRTGDVAELVRRHGAIALKVADGPTPSLTRELNAHAEWVRKNVNISSSDEDRKYRLQDALQQYAEELDKLAAKNATAKQIGKIYVEIWIRAKSQLMLVLLLVLDADLPTEVAQAVTAYDATSCSTTADEIVPPIRRLY